MYQSFFSFGVKCFETLWYFQTANGSQIYFPNITYSFSWISVYFVNRLLYELVCCLRENRKFTFFSKNNIIWILTWYDLLEQQTLWNVHDFTALFFKLLLKSFFFWLFREELLWELLICLFLECISSYGFK